VSGRADFVFAKYKLIGHCESQGIAHAPFVDFADTIGLLHRLEALAPRALELAA